MDKFITYDSQGEVHKSIMDWAKYINDSIKKAVDDGGLVAVVRCRECKHFLQDEWSSGLCRILDRRLNEYGYCSYGERRSRE